MFNVLTKITASQNEVALSYHRVRGLYLLAVIFVATLAINVIPRIAYSGADLSGGEYPSEESSNKPNIPYFDLTFG